MNMKNKFIPANMPGCQMMSNLNYIPAQPELYRMKLNYIPASYGSDAPLINNKVNNYKFIPCSSSASIGPPGATTDTSKKLSWWEDISFFKYPCILISAFYGIKWPDNFREYFNIPDDFTIVGDSGGFQNMTQDINMDTLDILRWQEKNCDIGFTFDLPFYNDDTKKSKQEKQIKTVENAYFALNNRENKNLKLYAVIQGHTSEEQNFILDEYKKQGKIEDFDGFAIGGLVPISGNIKYLVKVLTNFVYKIKEHNKSLHFFGLSGLRIIPIIAYIQSKVSFNITFDSASYGSGSIRKEYWLDYGRYSLEFSDKNPNTIEYLPCKCPICSVCSPDDMREKGSVSGGLIALHNLYQSIQYVNMIYSLIKDREIFKDYIKKNNPESLEFINYIDCAFEKGIEFANKKYMNDLSVKKDSKSSNIFSY